MSNMEAMLKVYNEYGKDLGSLYPYSSTETLEQELRILHEHIAVMFPTPRSKRRNGDGGPALFRKCSTVNCATRP